MVCSILFPIMAAFGMRTQRKKRYRKRMISRPFSAFAVPFQQFLEREKDPKLNKAISIRNISSIDLGFEVHKISSVADMQVRFHRQFSKFERFLLKYLPNAITVSAKAIRIKELTNKGRQTCELPEGGVVHIYRLTGISVLYRHLDRKMNRMCYLTVSTNVLWDDDF